MVPAEVVLSWDAHDESCASARTLQDAIAERLGYDPVKPEAKRTVHARLYADGPRYELVVSEGEAERRYRGTCEDVVQDAALAIAMALDPLRVRVPPPASPPPPPRAQPTAPTPSRAPTPPRRTKLHFSLGLHGGAGVGQLPGLSWRAGLEPGVEFDRLFLALGLQLGLPSTASTQAQGRTVEARIWPQQLGLTAGAWLRPSLHVHIAPIVGVGVDRLSAEGQGGDVNRTASPLLPRARAGVRVAWRPTPPLILFVEPSVGVTLGSTRMHMQVDGQPLEIWKAPVLSGQVLAGATFVFGKE